MEIVNNIHLPKILNIVKRLSFFYDFSLGERKKIINFKSNFLVYKNNECIIKENSHSTSFYILLSGTVNVTKGEEELPITQLEPGEFFGEISFITNTQRTANVIANGTVIVIRVNKELLKELHAEIREKIKDKIIYKLISRLDYMNDAYAKLF